MENTKIKLEGDLEINRVLDISFEQSPDFLVIVDKNLNIIKASIMFVKKTGNENLREIVGKNCSEILNDGCIRSIQNVFEEAKNSMECIKHMNKCIFKSDPQDTWYEIHVCPLISPIGETTFLSIHMRDITSQKKLESKLAEQNERLWLLHEIDKSMNSVTEFNSLLKIILNGIIKLGYGSASLFFLLEKENFVEGVLSTTIPKDRVTKIRINIGQEKELISETIKLRKTVLIRDITYPERYFNIDRNLKSIINGKSIISIPLILGDKIKGIIIIDNLQELTLKQKDLQLLELFATKAAITINNAELYSKLYKFNQELGRKIEQATIELKANNIKLKELDKTKTALLSVVSHELRTPLTSIKGYASLFKNNKFGEINEKQKEAISIIISEADKLKELVTSVIELSRLVSGTETLNLDNVDLCDIIKEEINETEALAEEKDISVSFIQHGIEHKITIDPEKIRLVMKNLLSNAIKFNKVSGKIEISLNDTPHFIQVNIKDTGVGIPKEHLDKIFEQFSQLEEHMTRTGGGAGIGLSIVKEIVNMHQGDIWVTSVPNKSTEFYFTLPKEIRLDKIAKEENELVKARRELENLRTILDIIQGKTSLRATLELILESIKETIGFDRIRLYLLDIERKYLKGAVGINAPKDFDKIEFNIEKDSFMQNLFQVKKAKVYHYYDNTKLNTSIGMSNETPFAAMPILVRGDAIGIITGDNILSQKITTRKDLASFTDFVNSAAIAITNATFLEATESKVNERTKELQQINDKLKKMDLMKNDFLNYVSHEIRTPLTSLIGYSKLLLIRDSLSHEDKKKSIEVINKEAMKLKRMIDDLLDLSKLEEGAMEMRKTPTNLYQIIMDVIDTMRPIIKEKNLEVNIKGEKIPLTINIDKDKIEQVIMNLLSNALKFTEKGGITIGLDNKENEVVVYVKDTGVGIAKENFDKVFDKFKQIDNKVKTEKGSGLGLVIAKHIVEAHSGKIWMNSELNKGTTFYFSLPK